MDTSNAIPVPASRRGLVYLRKREIPDTLAAGTDYKIAVGLKQKAGTYRDAFRRVVEIANARLSRIAPPVQVWTIARGWGSMPGALDITVAFLAVGLRATEGEESQRVEIPDGIDWTASRGDPSLPPGPYDEMYNAFDFGGTSSWVSYGESVASCQGVDFAPFIERAEQMSAWWNRRHFDDRLEIQQRSWYCVTDPNLVTVEILSAAPPEALVANS